MSIVDTKFDSNTTMSMSVRTRASNGILFVLSSTRPNQGASSVVSFVTLQMLNGMLFYRYKYNTEMRSSFIHTKINDGSYHDIEVSKNNVTVDGSLVYSPSIASNLPVKLIYIGGVDNVTFFRNALNTTVQYSGCLQAASFNGAAIASAPLAGGGQMRLVSNSTAKPGCNGTNVCAVTPCKNAGNCTDLWNAYNCTCAAGFSGSNCTLFGCAVQNNCPQNTTCFDLKPATTTCESDILSLLLLLLVHLVFTYICLNRNRQTVNDLNPSLMETHSLFNNITELTQRNLRILISRINSLLFCIVLGR